MITVGIVGGTGYTGVELLRLLAQHPEARVRAITSRKDAGTSVAQMFPSLRGHYDLTFSDPKDAGLGGCDVVFFATPHGVAMAQARELLAADVRIIDLAADFRLADPAMKKAARSGRPCFRFVRTPGRARPGWVASASRTACAGAPCADRPSCVRLRGRRG